MTPVDGEPRGLRQIRSADPSLSPEANARVTEELRAVLGADRALVPLSRRDEAVRRHGRHGAVLADVIGTRPLFVYLGLTLACVAAVCALMLDSPAVVVLAFGIVVVSVLLALRTVLGLLREREHAVPSSVALLEEEGVGDPDRFLQDLTDEFRTP